MAPSRSAKVSGQKSDASSSKAGLNQTRHKSAQANSSGAMPFVPGVQKVKAALRQTRRLLAKDNLAADVRIVTERKQKALEAELVNAERARKERTLAQRYHKVKFFEKQKVTRKLKQTQRQLEACTDKKGRKKFEKALFELRVDLNYIIHYPKLKKYISLFPPEVRQPTDEAEASSNGKAKEEEAERAATDNQREEIRCDIRGRMENGELSTEPERDQGASKTERTSSATKREGTVQKTRSQPIPDISEDAFFGEDSDEEVVSGGQADGDEDEDMQSE